MKRIFITAGLLALLAAPAAAQLMGLPVWNSPKGGTGFTINGDFGKPADGGGGGTAFGARASVGLANLTVTGGVSTWDTALFTDPVTSFGGTAAFRVIGGSLLPVAVNLLAGGAKQTGGVDGATVLAGAGLSAGLPVPGLSLEPYITVANVWFLPETGSTDSHLAVTFGGNATFGIMGVHVAYQTISDNGASSSVFGIGAHVTIKAPI